MKKLLAVVLLLCMMLTVNAGLAEVTYPIKTDKPVTITIWMEMNAGASQIYTNYMENPLYQGLQAMTGVQIEMVHPAYGATKEGFALMLAGDLPDIIIGLDSLYTGGVVAAYDDGLIYDLTPYLEENAPDYYGLINQSDDYRRQFYTEDGQVLAFYSVVDEEVSLSDYLIVRPDWCEEAGIDPATLNTFDKLEVYFQWILDNKPGVIPFLTNREKTFYTLGAGYNVYQNFYNVDGTVYHYSISEQYRAFLSRLASWYQKGYLGQDFGVTGNGTIRKMYSAGQVASLVVPIGNAYSDSMASGTPIYKTPFQEYEEGAAIHVYELGVDNNGGNSACITTACNKKLVPIVCQFLNYGFSEEGRIYANWGAEVNTEDEYDWNDNMSWHWVDGERKYVDYVLHNELYETSIMHNVARMTYYPQWEIPGEYTSPNLLRDEEVLRLRLMYSKMDNWDNEWIMPKSVALTTEENSERLSIMANVDTYVSEMSMKFVRGEADIETGWDAYVQQLMKYKLDRAIEITQGALDRYMSR